jgi:hypothetical protein
MNANKSGKKRRRMCCLWTQCSAFRTERVNIWTTGIAKLISQSTEINNRCAFILQNTDWC